MKFFKILERELQKCIWQVARLRVCDEYSTEQAELLCAALLKLRDAVLFLDPESNDGEASQARPAPTDLARDLRDALLVNAGSSLLARAQQALKESTECQENATPDSSAPDPTRGVTSSREKSDNAEAV